MLAYKDSKVPANLRNVKFNKTAKNCQFCPISRELSQDDERGWFHHPNLPIDTSRATCVDFLGSQGAFRKEKKNIQKRWEDFLLKSFGGLWPWTSWTLPNTKTQDLGFIVSLLFWYIIIFMPRRCATSFDMKFLKKRLAQWRSCQEAWKVATKSPWETVSRKSSKVFQWSLLSSIPVPVTRRICKGGKYV